MITGPPSKIYDVRDILWADSKGALRRNLEGGPVAWAYLPTEVYGPGASARGFRQVEGFRGR
jgi:hypothetical protein